MRLKQNDPDVSIVLDDESRNAYVLYAVIGCQLRNSDTSELIDRGEEESYISCTDVSNYLKSTFHNLDFQNKIIEATLSGLAGKGMLTINRKKHGYKLNIRYLTQGTLEY